MAFAKYRMTMDLCKKAAAGGPEELKKILKGLRGYDFRPSCKVTPPVGCCFDPYEMMNAERCFTWFPQWSDPAYYEPFHSIASS